MASGMQQPLPPALNVIALISGGKDSLFSILHVRANGHRVVALGNLFPGVAVTSGHDDGNDDEVGDGGQKDGNDGNDGEEQDINSYMYQTVGHSVIPLYEEALEIPLYRQEIRGTAVDAGRDYGTQHTAGERPEGNEQELDETEDLIPLLMKIKKAHPEANALSTGAILSTYQRTRIEHVALRMGLTPLSYLWQYPVLPPYTQSSLLSDMAAVGQEAIIIKTASGGLDEGFLGLDVAAPKTVARVKKAMSRFGEATNGAIVGEGGEFESLALSGPKGLWKRRIVLKETEAEVLDGGQAALKIGGCGTEEIQGEGGNEQELRIPELFDAEFKRVLDALEMDDEAMSTEGSTAASTGISQPSPSLILPRNICNETPSIFTISNLASTNPPSNNATPSQQLSEVLLNLYLALQQRNLARSSINHCTLLLRNMSDFTTLNPEYAKCFNTINPPARVTVAVGDAMPSGIDVMLSVVLDKQSLSSSSAEHEQIHELNRQGLHVQGRSYWAPANIGPYSQAISVTLPSKAENCEVVYIAGQIPLVPASMEVYNEKGFEGQAVLSLQHLWRIGRAKSVKWWSAGVAFIPADSGFDPDNELKETRKRIRIAQRVWRDIHTPLPSKSSSANDDDDDTNDEDRDEDIDPWDRLNRHAFSTPFNDETYRSPIPDFSALATQHNTSEATQRIPPCFVAQIASLPRGVDIEWSALGLNASGISLIREDSGHLVITGTKIKDLNEQFVSIEIRTVEELKRLLGQSMKFECATFYAGVGVCAEICGDGDGDGTGKWEAWEGVQWIPCLNIWGEQGNRVCGVLVGRIRIKA